LVVSQQFSQKLPEVGEQKLIQQLPMLQQQQQQQVNLQILLINNQVLQLLLLHIYDIEK